MFFKVAVLLCFFTSICSTSFYHSVLSIFLIFIILVSV